MRRRAPVARADDHAVRTGRQESAPARVVGGPAEGKAAAVEVEDGREKIWGADGRGGGRGDEGGGGGGRRSGRTLEAEMGHAGTAAPAEWEGVCCGREGVRWWKVEE